MYTYVRSAGVVASLQTAVHTLINGSVYKCFYFHIQLSHERDCPVRE